MNLEERINVEFYTYPCVSYAWILNGNVWNRLSQMVVAVYFWDLVITFIPTCACFLIRMHYPQPPRNRLRWSEGTCVRGEPRWPPERRGGLPQVQAHHGGCSGKELPHQLPRHGPDPRQDVLHGQEVAGNGHVSTNCAGSPSASFTVANLSFGSNSKYLLDPYLTSGSCYKLLISSI